MKSKVSFSAAILLICLSLVSGASAQIASGGNYAVEKSVVAGGGASGSAGSAGGNYKIEGTIGQNAAGTNQQNADYKFQPGFWTAAPTFMVTAAEATVGGRVLTADGRGIGKVLVTMVRSNGESRTVLSGAFGYFQFVNVAVGDIYVFSVSAKQFTFGQPPQVRSIRGDTDDIIFTADDAGQIFMPPPTASPQP